VLVSRTMADVALLDALQTHLLPFQEQVPEALVGAIGARRLALLGEASHGTHEFYALRAAITRELVERHGCRAIVVEGDWPDAWRINRWVRGLDGGSALDALAGFERFPTWMWRNTVIRDFIAWLRDVNLARPAAQRVGFYGMDLYSLFASVREVLAYLDRADPEAARRARRRYACFDHYQQNLQAYGYAAGFGTGFSCEDAVVAQLTELLQGRPELPADDPEALFHAQQNARLVLNAEHYYRSMFRGRAPSWNLRDLHMVDTLQALSDRLGAGGRPARMAVWAHNSHLGDCSATAMAQEGEWNVGDLARRRWPHDTFLLGFTTYDGTVRAANAWDEPGEEMAVRPGLEGSWEALLHATGHEQFALLPDAALRQRLDQPLLERAIGVVYLPETERRSHYFSARIGAQFDAVVHVDRTRALQPLPATAASAQVQTEVEVPETYPAGV
jgi:erythromycin esterase-like protein